MKKSIIFLSVLLFSVLILMSYKAILPKHKKNAISTSNACTTSIPTVSISYSGSNVIVTFSGGGIGNYYTVGGYYHSGRQIPYSCPATSGYTFPKCDATSCGGTLRVTSWCGTCAAGTNSQVSAPTNF